MTPDVLLRRILAITEGTPYQGTITASSGDDNFSVSGDVVFQLKEGRLKFDFYIDSESEPFAGHRIPSLNWRGEGETTLDIPSRCFKYPIRIESLPDFGTIQAGHPTDRERLMGQVDSEFLGSHTVALSSAILYIRDLPGGVWGVRNTSYRTAVVTDEQETPGNIHRLNSLPLHGGGWTINLQEIPEEMRVADVASHSCAVIRDDKSTFTGNQVMDLLEHDLGPFLCLMFGQRVMWSMVEGRSAAGNYPATPWGMIYPRSSGTVRASGRNWFLLSNGRMDPSPLFEKYCSMPPDRKRHFHRVIERYVGSEIIMGYPWYVRRGDYSQFLRARGADTFSH